MCVSDVGGSESHLVQIMPVRRTTRGLVSGGLAS